MKRDGKDIWACCGLAILTFATYLQVWQFGFVQWDDPYYPLNVHLRNGFTLRAIQWAFTTGTQGNWHPLTWLSHMLDYQLFGPHPGAAHLSGLFIHIAASIALYVFLRRATGTYWRSLFVALVFALHPVHVESVAWVSERKDVLCALFWFLACLAWVRYVEAPSTRRYRTALVWFCLGLLSKPMIVTLPIVLVLLDLWPLGRAFSKKLIAEKIPFLALSAVSAAIAVIMQQRSGAVRTAAQFPLGLRIENALTSWMVYLGRTFWPVDLSFFYPYPKQIPWWWAVLAGLALISVSALALRFLRRYPWFAVGWFWYVVTTLPVIGLVQVGIQARADRYLYIPMVGIAIVGAWAFAEMAQRWPPIRIWVAGAAAAACAAMIPVTWKEAGYWRDNESLFGRAIGIDPTNSLAYHNLAVALSLDGRPREALPYFDAELRIDPGSSAGHSDRGEALWRLGRKIEAIAEFRKAITLSPPYPEAHVNYGSALATEGLLEDAVGEYRAALALDPEDERAYYNLGLAYLLLQRYDEAIRNFDRTLEINPGNDAARNNRELALAKKDR